MFTGWSASWNETPSLRIITQANVQTLLDTPLEIMQAGQLPPLKVDRRYGSEQLLADLLLANSDIGAICNKASGNPFLSSMQMDEQKGKWKVKKRIQK